ncbi:hypothetical protein B0H16DRAFT_407727 [Mycena metata]|uniref:DUF6535 domain-containing protein n=1 Tax=Mycena metata TaxID=1033252 RepID=A0AAD7HFB1_9AGAR|nr:hypothetical protein B0H16DRAFT_407727 [Mycena metata]
MPNTDTKTAFWNSYKTLADEHDRDLQQRYSTDLDTALIFAGLFSAVDSAFIIQIQPGIQVRSPDLVVLVAQNLLYFSLFSTLLAALLAVLGKQWLTHYLAASERGTIEARGLERQRKLDGLHRWKFDTVMQIFPLLLQIGLFLFSAGLSIYLWRIHISLAIVVLSFTAFGFISYTVLLISAVAAPDSPFQTPLAPVVARLIPTTFLRKAKTLSDQILVQTVNTLRRPKFQSVRGLHLLPFFMTDAQPSSPKKELKTLFSGPPPKPSPAVHAVSWILEASTDPRILDVAADLAIELQWPIHIDVRPLLTKLRDSILTCFHDQHVNVPGRKTLDFVRDGMSTHAIHLARAYCTLRCVLADSVYSGAAEYWCFEAGFRWSADNVQLENAIQLLEGSPALIFDTDARATKWALNVAAFHQNSDLEKSSLNRSALERFLKQFASGIPALDKAGLADYFFCVNSFLSSPSRRGVVWMDKSSLQGELFEQLFDTLASNISSLHLPMATAASIIDITGQIAVKSGRHAWHWELHDLRHSAIYTSATLFLVRMAG